MALQQPRATVPAKDGIVVARRPNHFRSREAAHPLFKKRSQGMRRASYMHLRLGSPLMQQTGVIETFVALDEVLEQMFDFSGTIRGVSAELVGDRQAKQAKRQLVLRLDRQDVAANRFGLLRFIERAVEL